MEDSNVLLGAGRKDWRIFFSHFPCPTFLAARTLSVILASVEFALWFRSSSGFGVAFLTYDEENIHCGVKRHPSRRIVFRKGHAERGQNSYQDANH